MSDTTNPQISVENDPQGGDSPGLNEPESSPPDHASAPSGQDGSSEGGAEGGKRDPLAPNVTQNHPTAKSLSDGAAATHLRAANPEEGGASHSLQPGTLTTGTTITGTGDTGTTAQNTQLKQTGQTGQLADASSQQANPSQGLSHLERRDVGAGGGEGSSGDSGGQQGGARQSGRQAAENADAEGEKDGQGLPSQVNQGGVSANTAQGASPPHSGSATSQLGNALESLRAQGAKAKPGSAGSDTGLNLTIASKDAVERVARGLDKAGYDTQSVSSVVSVLAADLGRVRARIGDLEQALGRRAQALFGARTLPGTTDEERAALIDAVVSQGVVPGLGRADGGRISKALDDSVRAQLSRAEMLDAATELADTVATLAQFRALGVALGAVVEQPESLVPTLPVYALEADKLAQVEWAAGGKTSGFIVFSRVFNGDLQRVRLDVARTVDGDVVLGRLDAGRFRAIDLKGRATHEFVEVAHGLWGVGFAGTRQLAERQREARGLLQRAQRSLSDGAPGLAEATFKQALQIDPDNGAALMGHAEALLAQGRPESALASINRVTAVESDHPKALYLQGVALKGAGAAGQAEQSFRAADRALSERMSGPLFGNPVFWDRDDLLLHSQVLSELGQYGEASAVLDRVLEHAPGDVEARECMGRVLLAQGLGEAALREFSLVHESSPQSVSALLGVARAESMLGWHERASWRYVQSAQTGFEKGQYQQAIAIYNELLDKDPHNAAALTGLGFAYDRLDCAVMSADAFARAGALALATGRHEDALRNFDYALARAPRHLPAEVGRGQVLLATGNQSAAMESFDRVLGFEPGNVSALIGKGEACIANWDYSTACDCLDQVLERDPTNLRAVLASARLYLNTGAFGMAAFNLDLAQQLAPDNVEVKCTKAQCDLKLGHTQAALEGFESILAGSPLNAEALDGRVLALSQLAPCAESAEKLAEAAAALMARGSVRDACALYQRVVSVVTDHYRLWAGLGRAHFELEEFKPAREAFAKAFSLQPDDVVSALGMARSSMGLSDFDGAYELFEQVRLTEPSNLTAVLGSAAALLGMKRAEEALDGFATVLLLDDQNVEAFVGKGEAHLAVGEIDAARRSFGYALGIEPGNAKAIAGMQAILRFMNA